MSDRLDDVTAALLVGGLGTRLRPVIPNRQKTVAPVAGRPFLTRLLDQVADAGLRRVVLCTGYQADQVADAIGHEYRGLTIRYSAETSPLGTAGALRQALPLLESDTVLAMNGDSYCETDLADFWRTHRERRPHGSLVVVEVPDARERGSVTFDESGLITSFFEKKPDAGTAWISAGIYLLGRNVVESVPSGRAVSIERETFPAWVGRGLYAFPTRGKFLDIGTPDSYSRAQDWFQ